MSQELTPKFHFPFSNDSLTEKKIEMGRLKIYPEPLGPLGCMEFFEQILHMFWTLNAHTLAAENSFGGCSLKFEDGAFYIKNGDATQRI